MQFQKHLTSQPYCVYLTLHINIHRLCREVKPGEMTTKLEVNVILQCQVANRKLIFDRCMHETYF